MKRAKRVALLLLLLSAPAFARPAQADKDVRRLTLPGLKWALEVTLPGFVVKQEQTRGDGKGVMIMASAEDGYVVSVFLEPVPHGESVKQLRDLGAGIRETSPFKLSDFKTSEHGQIPTLEYVIKEYQGLQVNQKHLNAYFVHDGYWVDVHFSKTLYKPGDEKLFYSVIDTVRFVEGAPASASAPPAAREPDAGESAKLFIEGNAHFNHGDYEKAVGPYSKALELEKQNRRLPRYLWRVLVDNLTMSYGISGDLKSAMETAEYGLSKDPDYPMFHYLIANTYAEMGDLDNTILYLRQAFARKQNMNEGEQMPDPATDDSFQRFMKNEKFLAALEELKK